MDPRSFVQRVVALVTVTVLALQSAASPAAGLSQPARHAPDSELSAPLELPQPNAEATPAFSDSFQRLYFTTRSLSGAGAPTVPYSGEWNDTSAVGRYMLSATPQNTVNGTHGQPHASTVHSRLHRQFLFRLSGSGTLEGWVRAFLRTQTRSGVGINEAAQDMISQMVVRVVSANGATVRGVALQAYNPGSSGGQTTWDAYAMRNRKFPAAGRWGHPLLGASLNPVAYQDGDYLVVEIGLRNFTTTHVTGGSSNYNDTAASDLPEDEVNTTNLRSWIEFSPPSPTYQQMLGNCLADHGTCPWHFESDPVNTASGNYVSSVTDLALPGRGLGFDFTRTYNSLAFQPPATPPPSPNLVRFPTSGSATYTASRQYSSAFAPPYAADGATGNTSANNATWAVNSWVPGDWWQVTWTQGQALDRIVLCDRRTGSWYFGSSGRITFSDGSTVNWSGLPDDCGSTGDNVLEVSFPRKTGITWFRVIGDAGGYGNAGLAEVEAYDDATAHDEFVRDLSSPFGAGWTHSYAARLDIRADGKVTFHAEDGSQLEYWPIDGGYSTPHGVFSTLTALGDGSYELKRRDQVVYRFDAAGRLTALVDRNGNQLSFAYTAGQLTTITDTVGRTVTLSYTDGRITSLSGPPSRTITFTYDALNRLSTVTDARGKVWTYTYDSQHRLVTVVDPNDHTVVTNEYGPDGRISAQTDARGKRGTFGWDPATEVSTYTDARGKAWIDDYDHGRLVLQEDPLGNERLFAYDADFNLTSITDPRGYNTTQTWDATGNLLTRTAPAPLGYVQTRTYTARNDVATYTDGRSHTTTYSYDPAGNLTRISAPEGAETDFGRDPAGTGLLVSLTDPRDKITTYGYDAAANLTSTVTPLGNRTTMGYDTAGRLSSVVDMRGNVSGANPADYTTTFTYNPADQLLTATDPLGHVTTSGYDDAGNLTSVTDPNSHATAYGYDAANNLTTVTDAANEVTAYAYDNVGNLISRTDANDHVTTYAYDDANRLSSTTDPLTNVWSLTYDPAGNLATRTDAKNHVITYSHDALNRLTGIAYADPATPDVTLAYDANGNLTTMTDGAGTETYVYDDLDRLETVTRGTSVFSYGYDPASNLTSRTYPDATLTSYSFDDDGRMATAAVGSATTTYGYDPAANLTTIATPDGYTARYAYDRAGRLTEVAHRTSTDLLSRFTYSLDPAGNRTAVTSRLGTVSYRYDDLNRLTGACWATNCPWGAGAVPAPCLDCGTAVGVTRPADPTPPDAADTFVTWTYDPVGNRLSEATHLGTTTYAYDAADRLTSRTPPGQSAIGHTYDDNGNQLTAGADTFTWDAADRMVSASANGASETYTYAGDGRRLSVTSGGSTTSWWWDVAHPLPMLALERDGSGAVTRRSTYGLSRIATVASGQTAYHHADGLGSVVDLTSPSGSPLTWAEYQPFGAARTSGVASGAPAMPFGFTGEFGDPTNLVHLRARQYDVASGRFLSTDPLAPLLTDPYVGTYAYVRQGVTNRTDPSGTFGWVGAAIGGAIGAVGSVGGYWVSTLGSGSEWDWGQAGAAFVTGGVSGAACGATVVLCVGVSGAASVAQYQLAPGDKDSLGYLASAVIGGVSGKLTFGPAYRPTPNWSRALLEATRVARRTDLLFDLAVSGIRSFGVSSLAALGQGFIDRVSASTGAVK